MLEGANRPGLTVIKVKAHQKEPERHDPTWFYWSGNADADVEAGRALQLEGVDAESKKRMEMLVYGLREVWRLHIAIMVQQNSTERFDFLVEAILPSLSQKEPGRTRSERRSKDATPQSRPDYPRWLQELVVEGMSTLPGLCLGQKKRGVVVKKKGKKNSGRCLDAAVMLPIG
eukprot:4973334-Amphidinium_carterae.1